MKYAGIVLFIAICFFFVYKTVTLSFEKQQITYELAEVDNIKYGLFDVDVWKDKIADIIVKKIDEFEITSENKGYIQGYIEAGFYKLLDELDLYLNNKAQEGNWFEKIIKNFVYTVAFDKEAIQRYVPYWASEIVTLIENSNTSEQVKEHLKEKIVSLINESKSLEDKTVLKKVLNKYGYDESQIDECRSYLLQQRDDHTSSIRWYAIVFFIIAFAVYILPSISNMGDNSVISTFKLSVLFAFFIIGILTPMISIDVRIDNFKFVLLGEEVAFYNQVLYFKSKSILQVVGILFSDSTFSSFFTGLMILLFSLLLPFTKLLCLVFEKINNASTDFTSFFINKTSKWSMADVMITAIFLSYLGINSVLNNLLKISHNVGDQLQVIPNNDNSNLEIGVLFFAFFVIFSLLNKSKETTNSRVYNHTFGVGKKF
jgi:hypothetical protein